MYLDYFNLSRLPFSIAPDPELLYLSPSHHEALAHLNYALTGHGGLICLTGEVGMGKTTLCRAFIDQVPGSVDIAYIFNPMLSAPELLQAICSELEIPCENSAGEKPLTNKQLIDRLYQSLIERYASGRKVICIIDEAQSMPAPLLEQIRLLTNLETNRDKLLTLILVGQPELQATLAEHSNRQLDQRITARFHLPAMNQKQLKPYLQHRLTQASCDKALFNDSAIAVIWAGSGGIPRLINSIADRALLGAYATNELSVTKAIAQQAVYEVVGLPNKSRIKPQAELSNQGERGVARMLITLAFKVLGFIGLSAIMAYTVLTLGLDNRLSMSDFFAPNPYQQLASINGLDIDSLDLTSCESIKKNSQFACLSLDWSVAELRKLNQHIAIYNGERWQVVRGETLTTLPQRSVILWQPVEGYDAPVKPGESHALIAWVREKLAAETAIDEWQIIAPNGVKSHDFHTYFDPILAQKVGSFQQSVGLKADRIIGLKTLLALQAKHNNDLVSDKED